MYGYGAAYRGVACAPSSIYYILHDRAQKYKKNIEKYYKMHKAWRFTMLFQFRHITYRKTKKGKEKKCQN